MVLAHQESYPLFDEEEFNSEAVQRVWQYLRRFNEDPRMVQDFYFDAHNTEGSPKECLKTLIRFVNLSFSLPFWRAHLQGTIIVLPVAML